MESIVGLIIIFSQRLMIIIKKTVTDSFPVDVEYRNEPKDVNRQRTRNWE